MKVGVFLFVCCGGMVFRRFGYGRGRGSVWEWSWNFGIRSGQDAFLRFMFDWPHSGLVGLGHHVRKSIFWLFACLTGGVAGGRVGMVLEFWDRKWTECLPTVCIRLATFRFDGIGASWSEVDFSDFCLCGGS